MRTVRIYQRTDAERMIRLDREEILDYAKKVYGTVPEYLWEQHPTYAVLRMKDTDKWYGVLMKVSRRELGIEGDGEVDIMNVRCDPEMAVSLLRTKGFLTGYLMDHNNWISVLLDGTVGETKILDSLDRSYDLIDGITDN